MAIRPFEAFLAFWLRKNWGEHFTHLFALAPIFASKKRKCLERAESLTETLATQANLQESSSLGCKTQFKIDANPGLT